MLPEQGITFYKREEYCADEPVLSPDLHSSPWQPVTREINNCLLSPVQSNSEKRAGARGWQRRFDSSPQHIQRGKIFHIKGKDWGKR